MATPNTQDSTVRVTRTGSLITLPPAASDGGVSVAEGDESSVGEGEGDAPFIKAIKAIDAERRRFAAANCPNESSSFTGGPVQFLG